MQRLGADVEHLDRLAMAFERAAGALVATGADLDRSLAETSWWGRDRIGIDDDVHDLSMMAGRLGTDLRALGREVRAQADAQRRVSAARSRSTGPPVSVLLASPMGDGRYVAAIGDVGSATHIVVLVPGMGARGSTFDRLLATARLLEREARHELGEGRSVAVIAWLGYDAPAGLDEPLSIGEVLGRERADAGIVALRSFLLRLHHRDDAMVTLVGHSYGSLVVAGAARGNAAVDRLVVLGSPGLGVDDLDGLGLAATTTVYAAAIPGDPVPVTEWFGENPASPDFGAIVVDATPLPGARSPGIVHAHSAYFDEGSGILANIVRIVIGRDPVTSISARR